LTNAVTLRVMLVIEDRTASLKCRAAIEELLLYFNLCQFG